MSTIDIDLITLGKKGNIELFLMFLILPETLYRLIIVATVMYLTGPQLGLLQFPVFLLGILWTTNPVLIYLSKN